MKISGIYKIQSTIHPERIYIGSTVDMVNRWGTHLYYLERNKHHSPQFQNHFNKYGIEDLEFSIIESGEYLDKNHLLSREQGWFIPYGYKNKNQLPYFNILSIAGSQLGVKRSQETKDKIGSAHRGKKVAIESIAKMVKTRLSHNIKMPEKTRLAINKANIGNTYTLGYKHTEETKEKYRRDRKGHSTSIETRTNISKALSIPIIQYDLNMNFIKEWKSSKAVKEEIFVYNIIRSLGDKHKTAGGFIWRYKKEMEDTV